MEPDYFGTEQFTDEDRAYKGSRFSEVRDALFANPYQKVWGGEGEPPLPTYEVTLRSALRGILPFGRHYFFRQAVERTVDSQADALLQRADKEPAHRQLYAIAELGKANDEPTRTPEFMRLRVAPEQPRIEGEALDFRDEIMAQIFDKGDPLPKRTLTFHIEVTDEGSTRGLPVFQRRTFKNWRSIGKLTFDNAVISYNGDFVIHFNHPTWRGDRNNPSTATRINGRKVR
jgi:hypothetical protein